MDDLSAYLTDLKTFAKENIVIEVTYLVSDLIAYSNAIGELELYNYFFQDASEKVEDVKSREPVEYWLVSERMADLLLKQNELVCSNHNVFIWGRCSSLRPVHFDPIIKKIFDDLNFF